MIRRSVPAEPLPVARHLSRRGRVLLLGAVLVGITLRVVALDRLPGVNGDEAWYGVNVNELLHGGTPFRQTPSGNFVNPVHSVPLLLISLVAEPSVTVLRAPEVWWGILTLVCTYPLLARPIGSRSALIATLVIAALPTLVAYARLGWDPSGAPFFSLAAIAFAMRDRPILAALCGIVAFAVHPTTIFLAPIALACWTPHAARRYFAAPETMRRRLRIAAGLVIAIAIPVVIILATAVARMGRLPSIEMVVARVVSPAAWLESALSIVRLISGVTAVTYIAGPMPAIGTLLADGIAMLAVLAGVGVAWRGGSGLAGRVGASLLVGIICSVIMFHVVAGPIAIQPGFERYAMALVIPIAVLCALGIDGLIRLQPSAGVALASVLPIGLIAVVIGGYFYPLASRGGDAHPTFRTGRQEPKAAAYEFVRTDSAPDAVVAVFAEDWWIYWPIRYLAGPDGGRVFVEMIGDTPPVYPPGVTPRTYPHPPDRIYAIVFDQGAAWSRVRHTGRVVFTAFDPIGRPILHVVALPLNGPLPFAEVAPWDSTSG
jgi:hypothetical protein